MSTVIFNFFNSFERKIFAKLFWMLTSLMHRPQPASKSNKRKNKEKHWKSHLIISSIIFTLKLYKFLIKSHSFLHRFRDRRSFTFSTFSTLQTYILISFSFRQQIISSSIASKFLSNDFFILLSTSVFDLCNSSKFFISKFQFNFFFDLKRKILWFCGEIIIWVIFPTPSDEIFKKISKLFNFSSNFWKVFFSR